MINTREVLKNLSRAIKNGEPITLFGANMPPAFPGSAERVDQAAIQDVLRRTKEGLPQAFSGVSDDSITSD